MMICRVEFDARRFLETWQWEMQAALPQQGEHSGDPAGAPLGRAGRQSGIPAGFN